MDALLLAVDGADPTVVLTIMFSALFGLFVGAVPGLTATMATALLVPITFFLPPIAAVGAIVTATAMAIFAGDIPGCLMRIPGTPASAAYVDESYAYTRKGQAETALGIGLVFSAIGGVFGTLVLAFSAPALAEFALKLQLLRIFLAGADGAELRRLHLGRPAAEGLVTLMLGLLFGSVGLENPAAHPRFTFDSADLLGGLSLIPAMIGLFAISEICASPSSARNADVAAQVGSVFKGMGGLARTTGARRFAAACSAP